jgi:N-acyl-L-homoserine lactone synthetase
LVRKDISTIAAKADGIGAPGDKSDERAPLTAFRSLRSLLERRAANTKLEIRGPHFRGENPEHYWDILRFRENQYRDRLPYLLCAEQERIDQTFRLDGRSAHFCAVRNGRIVGSVRATPFPFEFQALISSLGEVARRHAPYVELSRLAIDTDERRANLSMHLLSAVCEWAVQASHDGVLGFCRRGTRTVFERYGLRPTSPDKYQVRWRGDHTYSLMAGSWHDLLEPTTQLISVLTTTSSPQGSINEPKTTSP